MLVSLEKEVNSYMECMNCSHFFAKNKYIRAKRGFFNIFGSVLQFLTGTATEKDINAVRESIRKVSANQEVLLNITKEATVENRNAIQSIITAW